MVTSDVSGKGSVEYRNWAVQYRQFHIDSENDISIKCGE